MARPSDRSEAIEVVQLRTGSATFGVVGESPLVYHRMAEKAKRELLAPSGRKTKADRAQSIKHDPLQEYRDSVYRSIDPEAPTRLVFPAGGFKQALSNAALETPGATKTQIGRLVWIKTRDIAIYGVPQIFTTTVRNSDIRRTPDIRTRAILPEWAALVTFTFVEPQLNGAVLGNLLSSAGLVIGIGDGRQDKGALSFGQFRPVPQDDPDLVRIMAEGGREAQDAALDNPEPYDEETRELTAWFGLEMRRRGLRNVA